MLSKGVGAFAPRAQSKELHPVAVPEKIFGLTLILDFFDRCHSLVSLPPPQAAVDSLPTGRADLPHYRQNA